jgi:ribonuclease HI
MFLGYFDGATNPNPGELGVGACIYDENGTEILSTSAYREYGTNNEAEYLSLIMLLKAAIKKKVSHLKCHGDSKLIINHITGVFQVSAKFKPYLDEVARLSSQFEKVSFHWVKRDLNKRADELSKEGLKKRPSARAEAVKPASSLIPDAQPEEAISNEEIQASLKPDNRILVMALGNNLMSIQENGSVIVIDIKHKRCSCSEFKKKGSCSHIKAVLTIIPNTKQPKTALSAKAIA